MPIHEMVWRIDPAHATSWRGWDGEMVVYDDVSGDTLKLDVLMTVAFKRLLDQPASTTDLVEHLAGVLELDADPKLRRLTEIALERFADCGLVAPEPGPA